MVLFMMPFCLRCMHADLVLQTHVKSHKAKMMIPAALRPAPQLVAEERSEYGCRSQHM